MALRLAVLISGSGTTLQNLIDHIEQGKLDAHIECVISSRPDAHGLERAKRHGLETYTVPRKEYKEDLTGFNRDIWNRIRRHHAELVVLAGFMSLLEIPEEYTNHIINVHPALLPAFGGKGMFGRHVHEAVIEYGVKITGVTIHFIDSVYDHGPIILQAPVPVHDDDSPDSLAARVQEKERELYPQAIQCISHGQVRVEGRRVLVDAPR